MPAICCSSSVTGLNVFANLPLRFRQGTTVEFAARAEGIWSSRISWAGTMYSGSSAVSAAFRRVD